MNPKTMRKFLENTNDKIPTCCCDELQSTWNSRNTKKISADRCQMKELKYYSIKYACGFGGRDNFKGRGDGSRKTKTFQRGCPFSLELSLILK